MFIKLLPRSLFLQVVIGLVLGVLCGLSLPELSTQLKPLGDGFIKLIKMLIALIVFCVVVSGISGAGDLKKVGRIGLKSVIYFEVLTTFALILGLVVAYGLGLGSGANLHLNELSTSDAALYASRTQELHGPATFIMDLIPSSVLGAFAENNILQVLLFAVLFGSALNLVGEQASGVAKLINEFSHVIFRIMGMIVRLAPIGVFGAVAFTTSKYGLDSLSHLGALVAVFYVTCFLFVLIVLGSVLRLCGVPLVPFLRYFREELTIVMGTASSDAVLPQIMRKLEHMGIRSSTVGLVIPTGYSFNLDGFSIYLTLAVVFIAHATGTDLAMSDLLTILLVSLITSKGAHGIPGSALVILAATLTAVPAIPAAGLVLVLAVDWFMGIGRALTNLIGNCTATVAIARWDNDIDLQRAHAVLNGEACAPIASRDSSPMRVAVAQESEARG
ncbi:C4-dicarboxylate transporter DctA [Ectopseudomonas composti]|uniref:Aerobic C4-dicarboxylate transport protein n=2 Tax=Ectopseudomonas composti TaxID=658457 RepID=A0A1I5MC39_9GAMM|nr:C4-dicarboxylate transporter DctA [Pseudomonas composti]EZH83426.1 C4-dicarboxylate ABC transporter [Pseudomonas composti]SFP07070.1 aerobic C4-dicarboxylate transport protein [Pseudomonas composti]